MTVQPRVARVRGPCVPQLLTGHTTELPEGRGSSLRARTPQRQRRLFCDSARPTCFASREKMKADRASLGRSRQGRRSPRTGRNSPVRGESSHGCGMWGRHGRLVFFHSRRRKNSRAVVKVKQQPGTVRRTGAHSCPSLPPCLACACAAVKGT